MVVILSSAGSVCTMIFTMDSDTIEKLKSKRLKIAGRVEKLY